MQGHTRNKFSYNHQPCNLTQAFPNLSRLWSTQRMDKAIKVLL